MNRYNFLNLIQALLLSTLCLYDILVTPLLSWEFVEKTIILQLPALRTINLGVLHWTTVVTARCSYLRRLSCPCRAVWLNVARPTGERDWRSLDDAARVLLSKHDPFKAILSPWQGFIGHCAQFSPMSWQHRMWDWLLSRRRSPPVVCLPFSTGELWLPSRFPQRPSHMLCCCRNHGYVKTAYAEAGMHILPLEEAH